MREIKFRGKRLDNGEWVYGGYHHSHDFGGDGTTYITFYGTLGAMTYNDFIKVIPKTVGQFTGLLDKNGNKIFEGDIVKSSYPYNYSFIENVDIVMWDKNECAFMMGNGVSGLRHFYKDIIIEVIGNIHDNKELEND